jgi:YgiT-type zinc finger domain-containing protein
MKCIVCHGEDICEKNVTEEFHVGSDIVEVPISTLVCAKCGERYYDPPMMRYLDKIEEELKAGQIKLPETGRIYAYSRATA